MQSHSKKLLPSEFLLGKPQGTPVKERGTTSRGKRPPKTRHPKTTNRWQQRHQQIQPQAPFRADLAAAKQLPRSPSQQDPRDQQLIRKVNRCKAASDLREGNTFEAANK